MNALSEGKYASGWKVETGNPVGNIRIKNDRQFSNHFIDMDTGEVYCFGPTHEAAVRLVRSEHIDPFMLADMIAQGRTPPPMKNDKGARFCQFCGRRLMES